MAKSVYRIRKTITEKGVSVFMNDSLGNILEIVDFNEVSKLCKIMNVNSDNNCKYYIWEDKKNENGK